jgi:hypothetical protein
MDELFADGIGEITVTGPIVRIDLVSLSATDRHPDGKPRAVFRQRIVMPADAFINACDLMQQAARGLIESGVVARTPAAPSTRPPAAGGDRSPGADQSSGAQSNGSPNFK